MKMIESAYKVQVYKDKAGEWRWRIKHRRNNKIVAESGEGYKRQWGCLKAFKTLLKGLSRDASLSELQPIRQDFI